MATCPTCDSIVEVVTDDEGTSHYDPVSSRVLQDDLRQLLEALRLPPGAQPRSPHEVFQEALVFVKVLVEVADAARDLHHRDYPQHHDEALATALTRLGVAYGPQMVTP